MPITEDASSVIGNHHSSLDENVLNIASMIQHENVSKRKENFNLNQSLYNNANNVQKGTKNTFQQNKIKSKRMTLITPEKKNPGIAFAFNHPELLYHKSFIHSHNIEIPYLCLEKKYKKISSGKNDCKFKNFLNYFGETVYNKDK